jgi:hypothetical protein
MLVYRIDRCTNEGGFQLDVEELLLPEAGGPIAPYRCMIESKAPCAAN